MRTLALLVVGLFGCAPAKPTEVAGLTLGASQAEALKDHGCKTTTSPGVLECPLDGSVTGFDAPVWVELCDDRACIVEVRRARPDGIADRAWLRGFLDVETRLERRYGPPVARPDLDYNFCTDLPSLRAVCLAGGDAYDDVQWLLPEGFHVTLRLTRGSTMYNAYSVTYANVQGVLLQMSAIAGR